jgi:hypothetical protein
MAPAAVRMALNRDIAALRRGEWHLFRRPVSIADWPPRWHRDYAAGIDLPGQEASSFGLDHRRLPGGADIKVVWEMSRWNEIVRLAQAGWLGDASACAAAAQGLDDWLTRNPPFRGWNWTSALESGMRLVQFCWIHELLGASDATTRLADRIVPPHVYFTRRYRSFGSSANNHLLGELAGLMAALARWPRAVRGAGATLAEMAGEWEREVLAQFAPDGGNREQALHYQLYAWELTWHARCALKSAGISVSEEVDDRLGKAAAFYVAARGGIDASEAWPYGDSDDGFVTPLFLDHDRASDEWRSWMAGNEAVAMAFWLGANRNPAAAGGGEPRGRWRWFPASGHAYADDGVWRWHWDLSPLGYLGTAAHGHLDALHLSLWRHGRAILIDPGTGAYFADARLREKLSSWEAHNGPLPDGVKHPRRAGPFLWTHHHPAPNATFSNLPEAPSVAEVELPEGTAHRSVTIRPDGGAMIEDAWFSRSGSGEGATRWTLAPGLCWVPDGYAKRRWIARDAKTGEDAVIFEIEGAASTEVVPFVASPSFRQVVEVQRLVTRWTRSQRVAVSTRRIA